MRLYELKMRTDVGERVRTYTLAEVARLDSGVPDTWIDELAELHVGQRWQDSDGDWWGRIA